MRREDLDPNQSACNSHQAGKPAGQLTLHRKLPVSIVVHLPAGGPIPKRQRPRAEARARPGARGLRLVPHPPLLLVEGDDLQAARRLPQSLLAAALAVAAQGAVEVDGAEGVRLRLTPAVAVAAVQVVRAGHERAGGIDGVAAA